MALNRTRRPNKQRLVKGLERATTKASQKPVFTIKEVGNTYSIVNYLNNKTVLEDIPFLELAKKVCERYNDRKVLDKEYYLTLKLYYKHLLDLDVYKYNYDLTDDKERKTILSHRIGVSYHLLKKIKAELLKTV